MEEKVSDEHGFSVLGPAVGDIEVAFESAITAELLNESSVMRAYLAVCSFNGGSAEVALCLRFLGDSAIDTILRRCAETFSRMFNKAESLAIFPLDAGREHALYKAGVQPFYVLSNKRAALGGSSLQNLQ